ncbi:MAG: hypothetical protein KC431_06150, partial [Myxococcales bacterium]|nr:hypothetical protein [Myxococcales bacterium]
MPGWSEVRGYTLILSHGRGPDRYARVALVRKRTLFGNAYNVREARAEDTTRSGKEPEALGLGRMLSWRWLGQGEAEELLGARLRTLESLGYGMVDGEVASTRGAWDWLRELVDKQLQRAGEAADGHEEQEQDDAGTEQAGDALDGEEAQQDAHPTPHQAPHPAVALREAIERLGLEPAALIEGVAAILELPEAQLREPTAVTLRLVDPEVLALLLPLWLEHDAVELRSIGARWLALPATPYELDRKQLASWAESKGRLAQALAPRLP